MDFNTNNWPFYLRLENDFINALNYVTFSEDNYQTFSVEFERQILSIGSELDIVWKMLCRELVPGNTASSVDAYYPILSGLEGFLPAQVSFKMQDVVISPFGGWTNDARPQWWKAYNTIKHDRITDNHYKKGNLENTFYALAGLYAANRFLFNQLSIEHPFREPVPASKVFSMAGWPGYIQLGNGFVQVLHVDGSMSLEHE